MRVRVIVFLVVILQGCVFPTTHVVYMPDYAGGELIDSDVCGYLFNNKDTLKITKENYIAKLRIYSSENEITRLFFQLTPANGIAFVNTGGLKMVFPTKTLNPSSVTRHEYGKSAKVGIQEVSGVNKLSKNYFYVFTFPESIKDGESVILMLGSADIRIGSKEIHIDDITFTRKKVTDAFYATINC